MASPMNSSAPALVLTIAHTPVFRFPGEDAFFFASGMAIDADGAPEAYHPTHGKGLDALANAGHPGNWYGIVTDNGHHNGQPIVQGPHDPAPGFYVSPTALQDPHAPRTSPTRYVDSSTIAYISLPGHSTSVLHAHLGDLAMVINGTNGRAAPAVYADVGPRNKIGEGSIALAQALGLSSNARHGGTSNHCILYVVFPQSGHGFTTTKTITNANHLFTAWGGKTRLATCFPQFAAHLH